MKRHLVIILLTLASSLFGQRGTIKIKQVDSTSAFVGIWVNKTNKTKDNKEYTGLKCKDTIQYFKNGKYIWRQCDISETGSWKISPNGKTIILYERQNKYWQNYLNTLDLGEMWITISEINNKYFVSLLSDEELGSIRQYYYRLK